MTGIDTETRIRERRPEIASPLAEATPGEMTAVAVVLVSGIRNGDANFNAYFGWLLLIC